MSKRPSAATCGCGRRSRRCYAFAIGNDVEQHPLTGVRPGDKVPFTLVIPGQARIAKRVTARGRTDGRRAIAALGCGKL